MECLDDATVAVQLEPTLIKAIKKGGFFRRKPSTFYSLISSKEDCVVCVNKLSNTPACLVHVVERRRSRVQALDRTITLSLKISEGNVLPPKL